MLEISVGYASLVFSSYTANLCILLTDDKWTCLGMLAFVVLAVMANFFAFHSRKSERESTDMKHVTKNRVRHAHDF